MSVFTCDGENDRGRCDVILALLSLLVAARILLLITEREWIIVLVKIIIVIMILQGLVLISRVLPYS